MSRPGAALLAKREKRLLQALIALIDVLLQTAKPNDIPLYAGCREVAQGILRRGYDEERSLADTLLTGWLSLQGVMKDTRRKTLVRRLDFVRMRALHKDYVEVSRWLGIGKATCERWERELRGEILFVSAEMEKRGPESVPRKAGACLWTGLRF